MLDALVLPHNIGLAHAMRSQVLCKELQRRNCSVKLAYGGPYAFMVDPNLRFDGISNDYDVADYAESLRRVNSGQVQFPFGDKNRLERIVETEIGIITELKPKVVIGDTRLSLLISAQATSTPYVSVTNSNMTPYYKIIPLRHAARAQKTVEMYNEVLAEFGSKKQVKSFYEILVGNLNLIVDLSEFMPIKRLPNTARFVGPMLWSCDSVPEFYTEIKEKKRSGKKFVYVTMGATGDASLFETIIDGLKAIGYCAVVACGSLRKNLEHSMTDVYVADFISMDVLDYCDLTISHGGNSTVYLSLLHNCPIIGIPLNPDQIDNVNRAIALELGVGLYPQVLQPIDIVRCINHLVANTKYKKNVEIFSERIKKNSGEKTAARIIIDCIRKL